jgi:glyoxylase-like metal-dependent hydrolase (beta-lactamase superfamily II)
MQIRKLELGAWATNAYVVVCLETRQSVLVDVPPGARTLLKELRGTELKQILLTHSHIDHYAGLQAFRDRLVVPVAVHPDDNQPWLPFPPEVMLKDGQRIRVGKLQIDAIHTPGHTPGSVCFSIGSFLLAGDTLFPGGPGRTISDEAFKLMLKSVTKLVALPGQTVVCPGHGEPTVMHKEKAQFDLFLSRPHQPGLHGDVVWLTS